MIGSLRPVQAASLGETDTGDEAAARTFSNHSNVSFLIRERDDRELLDLTAHGITNRHPLGSGKHVPAGAALGPVLDHLVKRPRRQQRSSFALVTGLCTLGAMRGVLAAP